MPAPERDAYAREAADLLVQVASRPGNPFERDLAKIEPTLAAALNVAGTGVAATAVLGDVPLQVAQRGLADVLLDTSKAAPLRLAAAGQLSRSVQRFGPLVAADQEAKLLAAFDADGDPALRTALGAVVGNLRPKAAPTGLRLRQTPPSPASAPAAAPVSTSPESAPAPPEAGKTATDATNTNTNTVPPPPPGGDGRN